MKKKNENENIKTTNNIIKFFFFFLNFFNIIN